MKHSNFHFARKLRQFRSLAGKADRMLKTGEYHRLSEAARDRLRHRLRSLYQGLSGTFSRKSLRGAMAGAAILLGLGTAAQAQVTLTGPTTNPFGLTQGSNISVPELVDLDADGDLDLLTGVLYGGLQYWENTGSPQLASFAAPVNEPFGLDSVQTYYSFPTSADLDDDGDIDLMVGSNYGLFFYFENVGDSANPAFAPAVTNPYGLDTMSSPLIAEFADLDGDGDADLLAGGTNGNILYFENVGTPTAPAFATPVSTPFGLTAGQYFAIPATGDLDGDGDLDMVLGTYYGEYRYFQNTGTVTAPAFAAYVSNPFGMQQNAYVAAPEMGDLDGDGDLDILIGDYSGNFQYYQQDSMVVAVAPALGSRRLTLAPNPALDKVRIGLGVEAVDGPAHLQLVDLQGRVLLERRLELAGGNLNEELSLDGLAPGTYIARLEAGGTHFQKRFVKQ